MSINHLHLIRHRPFKLPANQEIPWKCQNRKQDEITSMCKNQNTNTKDMALLSLQGHSSAISSDSKSYQSKELFPRLGTCSERGTVLRIFHLLPRFTCMVALSSRYLSLRFGYKVYQKGFSVESLVPAVGIYREVTESWGY